MTKNVEDARNATFQCWFYSSTKSHLLTLKSCHIQIKKYEDGKYVSQKFSQIFAKICFHKNKLLYIGIDAK